MVMDCRPQLAVSEAKAGPDIDETDSNPFIYEPNGLDAGCLNEEVVLWLISNALSSPCPAQEEQDISIRQNGIVVFTTSDIP